MSVSPYFNRDYDTNQINYMYAQYVKNTMEPLNIPDVRQDKRFPWTVSSMQPDLKVCNRIYNVFSPPVAISYMTNFLLLFFPVPGRDAHLHQQVPFSIDVFLFDRTLAYSHYGHNPE